MKTTIKIPGLLNCPITDILYIEGKSNYSIIYLQGAEPITMAKTLKKFESQLRLHPFLRIHKSYLVNKGHLANKEINGENQICLVDGTQLPVSRRKRDIIKRYL